MKQKTMRDVPADAPIEVSGKDLDSLIRRSDLVVVDCWAPWCGPCRMIAPIVDELAKKYAGRVLFGKLNVDENKDVAMRFQITSIPTLLIFKDGKLADRVIGVMPRNVLEARITRHLEPT
jgi:thioredoxin 1